MKIAVWHNLPSGGGKRALYDQVRGLLRRGHKIEVWCPPTADRSFLPLADLVTEHVVPLARPGKIEKQLEAMAEHCRRCASEINAGDFDLLFAGPCTLFHTSPLAKFVKIQKILYLHEPYRWLYEASPQLPWKALPDSAGFMSKVKDWKKINDMRVQMREEISNAAAYTSIFVNSLYSRESILRAYGLDSIVCYLGVDTELFKPSGGAKENFVAGLGGIYRGKGVDRAIQAVAAVKKEKRPRLVWVGNFSEKNYQMEMEKAAAKQQVEITFKINISHNEVLDILSRAAALVYTSRLEPFGLAVLEANACGTPVAAIAEGGVRESVAEGINGFLVPGDNPEALGKIISKFSGDPKLASEMGLRARQYVVEKWGLEQSLDRLEHQLKAAVK